MSLFHFGFSAMASVNELQIWADTETDARRGADAAIADVLRIEAKYSRYRDDSVVTRINREAGNAEVPIDPETVALLRYADQCYRLSETFFDITSGALRRAWDLRRTPPRLPTDAELDAAVSAIGWCDVEWSDRAIRLPRAGMEKDLGGVGKEYAADRMATLCLEHGLTHVLVNLGGDVRVAGRSKTAPRGSWAFVIRDGPAKSSPPSRCSAAPSRPAVITNASSRSIRCGIVTSSMRAAAGPFNTGNRSALPLRFAWSREVARRLRCCSRILEKHFSIRRVYDTWQLLATEP
jgi:thiamine biosynthesis lipoprotein ApbE